MGIVKRSNYFLDGQVDFFIYPGIYCQKVESTPGGRARDGNYTSGLIKKTLPADVYSFISTVQRYEK